MTLLFQRAARWGAVASIVAMFVAPGTASASKTHVLNADITGTVTDSASGQPLASAEVSVMRGTQIVFNATADAFGRYTAHNIPAGDYSITARFLGFAPQTKPLTVTDAADDIRLDFRPNS